MKGNRLLDPQDERWHSIASVEQELDVDAIFETIDTTGFGIDEVVEQIWRMMMSERVR